MVLQKLLNSSCKGRGITLQQPLEATYSPTLVCIIQFLVVFSFSIHWLIMSEGASIL